MARLHDWRERLQVVLHDAENHPFEWGTYDCFSGLTSRCVEAIIGEDFAVPYRGQYTTALGALKLIKAQGFNDLAEAYGSRFEEVHPSSAWHGDIVIIPRDDDDIIASGILLGERIAVMHPRGYATVDRFQAKRAFRVE